MPKAIAIMKSASEFPHQQEILKFVHRNRDNINARRRQVYALRQYEMIS